MNCQNNIYARLRDHENHLIQNSLIEQYLLEHIERVHEFIPGAVKTGPNEFTFCGGRYRVKFKQPLSLSYPGAEIQGNPFNVQLGCLPTVYESIGMSQRIINVSSLAGKHFLSRICDILYRMTYNSGLSYDERDIQKSIELGDWLGIKGNWNSSVKAETATWNRCVPDITMMPELYSEVIVVRNPASVPQYHLQIFHTVSGYYVLPVSYFKNQGYGNALRLFIPPPPPYTLMNAEHLAMYPQAEVRLTDDIMLAKNTLPSHDLVHLCNPGGTGWIEHLDLQCLPGRKVNIALDNDDESRRAGLLLIDRLNRAEITNVTISIKGESHVTAI